MPALPEKQLRAVPTTGNQLKHRTGRTAVLTARRQLPAPTCILDAFLPTDDNNYVVSRPPSTACRPASASHATPRIANAVAPVADPTTATGSQPIINFGLIWD